MADKVSFHTVKNIWKSYIWTADKDVNESDPRSNVHYLGSSENKAWKKNSGLYGIWTHDLCDTESYGKFSVWVFYLWFSLSKN